MYVTRWLDKDEIFGSDSNVNNLTTFSPDLH